MPNVIVPEHLLLTSRVTDACNHGRVVQFVGKDDAAGQYLRQCRKCRVIGYISAGKEQRAFLAMQVGKFRFQIDVVMCRSEEHTSELQSLMRISYAVFCLKKKTQRNNSTMSDKANKKHTKTVYENFIRIQSRNYQTRGTQHDAINKSKIRTYQINT